MSVHKLDSTPNTILDLNQKVCYWPVTPALDFVGYTPLADVPITPPNVRYWG